jgi:hypothetical protein
MNVINWLARCARRVLRRPALKRAENTDDKRCAHAQLRPKLSPHLLKDVGVEDG